jgi:hypothetical protein
VQSNYQLNKYLSFQHINKLTTLELTSYSPYSMMDTLKIHAWKHRVTRKLAGGVKSNQQRQWRMWAVGWATGIRETCIVSL